MDEEIDEAEEQEEAIQELLAMTDYEFKEFIKEWNRSKKR